MNVTCPVALVVDDEPNVRRHLRFGLEGTGFLVKEANNGADALKWLSGDPLDLVVLDLRLPDIAGSEVLERLRAWSNTPTIMLTARATQAERRKLLRMGADDYVAKPVDMAEFVNRAGSLLHSRMDVYRRSPVVHSGPLEIDLSAGTVTLNGRPIKLTFMEFKFLQILARNAGSVVSHRYLIEKIWGLTRREAYGVRTLVYKVRQKIEADSTSPRIVIGDRGVGYRLHQN